MRSKDKKCLVFSRYENIRRSIRHVLKNMKINNVMESSDYADAIRLLNENSIDILLYDWDKMNGDSMKLLEQTKSNNQIDHYNIILISGDLDIEKTKQVLGFGVKQIIIKPFTPAIVQNKVSRLI